MSAHHTSSKPFTLSPSQLNVLRQSANRSSGTPGQLFNYGLLPRTREILLEHDYIINEYEVRDAAERQKLHDQYREAISNARAVIERDWKQAYELLTQATNLEHRLTSTCYWLTEKAFAALKDEDEP